MREKARSVKLDRVGRALAAAVLTMVVGGGALAGCGSDGNRGASAATPGSGGTAGCAGKDALTDHGRVRFRKSGEFHAYNPLAVRAAQKAAQTGDEQEWRRWQELSTMGPPQDLRDLLAIRPAAAPVPLDEVEEVAGALALTVMRFCGVR